MVIKRKNVFTFTANMSDMLFFSGQDAIQRFDDSILSGKTF